MGRLPPKPAAISIKKPRRKRKKTKRKTIGRQSPAAVSLSDPKKFRVQTFRRIGVNEGRKKEVKKKVKKHP